MGKFSMLLDLNQWPLVYHKILMKTVWHGDL